jgi:hypothetical protein
VSLNASEWGCVGKPWKVTVDREAAFKINRWVKHFQELEVGRHLTLYEPKAAKQVLDWAKANKVSHSLTKFRGGGWRIEKI